MFKKMLQFKWLFFRGEEFFGNSGFVICYFFIFMIFLVFFMIFGCCCVILVLVCFQYIKVVKCMLSEIWKKNKVYDYILRCYEVEI